MVTLRLSAFSILIPVLLADLAWGFGLEDDYEPGGGFGGDMDEGEGGGGGGGGSGSAGSGAISLDNMTLDKVVSMAGYPVLIKFDKEYPYGDAEDEFKTLCKLAYQAPNFLVGEVQVGDEVNDDLRERFGVKTEDFPAYFLLKADGSPNHGAVRYSGKVVPADLSAWLRRRGVKDMPAVGTIAELDEVAAKFVANGHSNADLEEAKKLANGDFKEDRKAAIYVKIMESILKKGASYVPTELARVEKVMAGSISDEKREQMSEKVRILGAFVQRTEKDEL